MKDFSEIFYKDKIIIKIKSAEHYIEVVAKYIEYVDNKASLDERVAGMTNHEAWKRTFDTERMQNEFEDQVTDDGNFYMLFENKCLYYNVRLRNYKNTRIVEYSPNSFTVDLL